MRKQHFPVPLCGGGSCHDIPEKIQRGSLFITALVSGGVYSSRCHGGILDNSGAGCIHAERSLLVFRTQTFIFPSLRGLSVTPGVPPVRLIKMTRVIVMQKLCIFPSVLVKNIVRMGRNGLMTAGKLWSPFRIPLLEPVWTGAVPPERYWTILMLDACIAAQP